MSIFSILSRIISAAALIILAAAIICIILACKKTDKTKKKRRIIICTVTIVVTALCWCGAMFAFRQLDSVSEYTITFDTNGGSSIPDKTVKKGDMLAITEYTEKDDAAFIGWYEDKDFNKRFDLFSPVERSCTLYARWLDLSSEAADIDGDGLSDESEEILGTDASSADSDNDGLSDSAETSVLGTDPLNADTDGNGISDADEDLDGDGIVNKDEIDAKTDPCLSDTDGDGLDDKQEIETTKTDPLEKDTDKDGADDGWEKENSFDPLTYNDNFEIKVQSETSDGNVVMAFAEVNENGKTASSIQISEISSQDPLLNPQIPGYLGSAYEFLSDGEISKAKISFQFNTSLGAVSDNFRPAIYYFDEESGAFEELENQSISDDVVSAEVTHFSKYILLNKPEFDRAWSRGAKISESTDKSDSNNDGISDYYSELIFSGDLVLSNGSKELCGIDFNYNADGDKSDDYDGDGVKNGDEISIVSKGGKTYISLRSDPTSSDTDGDGLSDAKDKSPLKWDISDRNLAMFCSMSYVLPYDYTFNFPVMLKDLPDQLKVKLNGEFNEFGNVASVEELYGWELISTIDKGFQAAAFRIDDNIVVAFTGTQGFDDWINDIAEGLVGHSPQPKFASAYLSTLMLNYPDCNFYITGHSLGGNLAYHAAYQGLKLDKERIKGIVTFNGLGLPVSAAVTNRETFKDESRVLSDNTSIIKDYRVHGDWVSDVLVGFVTIHYGGDPIYYDKSSDIPQNIGSKNMPALLANNLGFVGKDIANIDWNCHKLYTFLQNLEPKGHISSVYAKSPDVPVLSGAVLNVFDEDGEKYGNYHLTISTLSGSYNNLKPKTVVDEDINSADGYTLDLDEGTYLISVKDIGKKASKTEYKTSVKIIGATIRNKYYGLKSVKVYTDFKGGNIANEELKLVDYLGKTINDIKEMYGSDISIAQDHEEGSALGLYYDDGRVPLIFFFMDNDFSNDYTGTEKIVMVYWLSNNQESTYTVIDNVNTDYTLPELQNETTGEGFYSDFYESYMYTFNIDKINFIFSWHSEEDAKKSQAYRVEAVDKNGINDNLNPNDLTNDDIAALIMSAGRFNGDWFYYNTYADKSDTFTGVLNNQEWEYERINYEGINSINDLEELCSQYYTSDVIEELFDIQYKNWVEQNGKLYVSAIMGIGGILPDHEYKIYIKSHSSSRYELIVYTYEINSDKFYGFFPVNITYVNGYWVLDKSFLEDMDIPITFVDSPIEDLSTKLYEYNEACNNNHKQLCDYCSYAYVDIDNDGEDELIIQDGTCESDRTHHVYKMINGKAKLLGEYNAWHLTLYNDNGTIVGTSTGPGMEGKYNIYKLKINGQSADMAKTDTLSGQPGYTDKIEFTPLYRY